MRVGAGEARAARASGGSVSPDLRIRPATREDLPRVQAIYAHEVLTGTASFELEPPDVDALARRMRRVRERGCPYLVAVVDDDVVGYAYAAEYRPRPAYAYTVESSVYVAAEARRRGVGEALLRQLVDDCTAAGARQMVAVIGDSAHVASIALHAKCGFRQVGVLHDVGYKFHRWLDSVIMQRTLGAGPERPPDGGRGG